MKVLSYNISWSKQFKIDWLFTNKGIDAFVVPECANNDNIVVPDNFQFYWVGNYATKGLGVFVSKEHKQTCSRYGVIKINFLSLCSFMYVIAALVLPNSCRYFEF